VDTSLRWREEIGFDFSVHPLQMRPSDPPDNFRPGNHAILELKCDRASVPMWMLDLIRLLELERDGYSKYLAAMRESQLLPSIRGARW
ncbi:MAG: hypothetical protein RL318_2941, partial [Fibrobacterota bacterium]